MEQLQNLRYTFNFHTGVWLLLALLRLCNVDKEVDQILKHVENSF